MSILFRDGRSMLATGLDAVPFTSLVSLLGEVKPSALDDAAAIVRAAKTNKKCLFFIGNGGSAAIASHMAADYLKNGMMATQTFNDTALMSCISNDLGYQQVFSRPISVHGKQEDVLFAISSSGRSHSILYGVEMALSKRMKIITLSGFEKDNPLRNMGNINFYVPSGKYGLVEVAHHAICHTILDAVIG